ncbi:MAG: beta strand repeat-containing protein, partial [Thermodesulfobacteriota bacterium]
MKAAVSSHVSIVRRCRFAFSLFAAFPGRLAAVSILAAVLLWAAPSPAQTYDVDTTADSGAGSLRQAVDDLNASGAAGDIRFLSGSSGTIDLTTGGLTLTQQASLLNNSGGAVTVSRSGASDVTALLATSLGTIGGASALAISATATSGTDAYGIYSSGGALSIGAIASTGSITATAGTNYAYGLHGADGVTITGEMAGDIAASSGGQYAHGIYSSGGAISIGSIAESGSIEATAGTNWAYGLYAIAGVTITGEMAGDITATATSGSNARGIYSGGALSIGSIASTGSIMATAGGTTAYGLYGLFGVTIVGEMAGDITATAGGHTALGIWSGGTLGGGGASTPVSISGTVSARANGLAVAVGADGAMNLYVTGTLSGVDTSGSGEGYAIRAGTPDGIGGWNTGSADNNIVTLGHGATIIGKIDLGTGANNALTLLGVPNAATSIARISGVDSLAVGDGTTGTNWTLAPTATSSFGSVAIFPNAALTVNENVAITGDTVNNGALTFDLASNVSYAGVISGSGSLTKAGTATLVLSGDSTYTGSTLVSGGTLDVTGTLASQAYQVDSGATLTLHQNMTLTGTALVNGTMGSPELTIAATGTLAGSGTVTGDVVSSGLISPGNSPGTLTIAGNLYLGAGSTLFMEITPTVSDLVVVSGTTTIAGGALSLDVAQGYYSAGQTFTLLTSAGGITGAFDTITIDDHSQFLVFTVDVGDTAITAGIGGSVSVTRLPYTIAGTSRNAMGAAAGLTGATSLATPSMQVLLGTIDFMDASQVARGLRQMSPEPYSALTETAFSSMGLFSDTIRDRAYARRSGGETLLTAVSAGNIDRLTQLASAAGASDAGSGLSIKG